MPGVPPDAVDQVKKGLRGLFKRKKSKGPQQAPSEPPTTTAKTPTTTTTAAAPEPATTARALDIDNVSTTPHAPAQPAEAPAHHISKPSAIEEAKAVNLNPTTSSSTVPTKAAGDKAEDLKAKAVPASASVMEVPKAEVSAGMSATSGPLGDHMAEVYTDVDAVGEELGG